MLNILVALASVALAPADRVSEADLATHIRILASDEFEGRKPGTIASNKTLSYISGAWSQAGLRPGVADGSWYQPVALVDRSFGSSRVRWSVRGKPVSVADEIALTSPVAQQRLRGPVTYVGYGIEPAGVGISGQIVFYQSGAPAGVTDAPGDRARVEALLNVGAAAVINVANARTPWAQMLPSIGRVQTSRPNVGARGPGGVISAEAFDSLVASAGQDAAKLRAAAALPGFKPVPLGVDLDATINTNIRNYTSYNVVGRLPGRAAPGALGAGEAVAIIGHWDHLGICRPEGAPDRICNGAVDNASGIAVMIEVAERLARGPRPTRDVLFVATTAEESGLLGANAYVDAPTVPLGKIVALLNIDTIAIGPRGMPVSAVNRGNTAIDPLIDEVARQLGRTLDTDLDANAFIQRQDGAAFTRAGVPAVMAGGSFADMPRLQAFLGSVYHGPDDEFSDALPLGGAAEDAELHVLLARALADPARYQRKPVAAPLP